MEKYLGKTPGVSTSERAFTSPAIASEALQTNNFLRFLSIWG